MRSVVITACTGRKRLPPAHGLRARDLATGALEHVAQDWVDWVGAANDRVPASRLYCGRGFAESRSAARAIRAPLFIVSAGLGLITAEIAIPSYGLTITPESPDSILRTIQPRSSASAWWAQIAARSTLSQGFAKLAESYGSGLILLALPSPYLSMVEEELLELPQEVLARLRFFGLGILARIGSRLAPQVMPYDERLEDAASRFRGTRSDFGPRALRHFGEVVLPEHPNGSADQHRSAVITALAPWSVPRTPKRPRISDDQVEQLIRKHWSDVGGRSSHMLRLLRDDLSVACAQGRFRALFQAVRREREASP
jgi:hypothetical protein